MMRLKVWRSNLNYNKLPADQDTTIKVSGSVKMMEIEKGGKATFLLHCLCFLLSIDGHLFCCFWHIFKSYRCPMAQPLKTLTERRQLLEIGILWTDQRWILTYWWKFLKDLSSCSVIVRSGVSVSSPVSQGKCHGVPLAGRVSRSQTLGVTIPVFRSMNPVLESSRQLCSFLQTSLSKSKSFQRSLLPPLLVTLVVHLFSSNEKSNCAILSTLVWTIGQGRVWRYE